MVLTEEQMIERVKELIHQEELEIARTKVWEYYHQLEVTNPKHMGKNEALENLGLNQKHIESCEKKIKIFELFLTDKYGITQEQV